MRTFLFGSKRRKVFAALGALALTTGTAIAAFIIYSGVGGGSGSGTYAASSNQPAITVSSLANPQVSGPGTNTPMALRAQNNDPNAAHVLNSVTGTFTTSPVACASYMSLGAITGAFIGESIPASGLLTTGTVQIVAAANTPGTCAGGTWSVAFSGTTTP
jgi:hypothetical protein